MNNVLAAELFDLWKAGAINLPRVAASYAQVSRDTHNTGYKETLGMSRPIVVQGEAEMRSVAAYAPWSELRDLFQAAMVDTSEKLLASGEALVKISDAYAMQDETAAAELDDLRTERLNTPYLPQPPEEIPETRDPDDNEYEIIQTIDPHTTQIHEELSR